MVYCVFMIIKTAHTIKTNDGFHKTTLDGIYDLVQPQSPLPLIFDSPHSGMAIPPDFNPACDISDIAATADHYVDELFKSAPHQGAALLSAQFPRTYLDLNRKIDDIDPEIYTGLWPTGQDGFITPNPSNRSYAGIGLIRRLIKPNMPVYHAPLTPTDIQTRIDTYYTPYYDALRTLIDNAHTQYGATWHINCHSMPASSVKNAGSTRFNPAPRVDFVLGNRDGTTCDNKFTKMIKNALLDMGYNVAINSPYKGVELVERFSNPAHNRHSIQIEINKALYMNEQTGEKTKGFDKLQNNMSLLIEEITKFAHKNRAKIAAD